MSEEIMLPTGRIAPTHKNPRNLIIFSKPKTGKTTLAAGLDNALILDMESGSDFVSAMKLKVGSIADLKTIGEKIKEAEYPYTYLIIDTITALEDLCVDYAEVLYSRSPEGKSWFTSNEGGRSKYGNILNMPNGAGYKWHRDAYTKAIDYIQTLAPNIIQMGHVKDIQLGKEGNSFSATDLDLTGKLKRIACSRSDSIGYLYRKGNRNILSFMTSDTVLCGARSPHLANQEIVISEILEDGSIEYHWDKIFVS